jgi:zinc transport system substrate-binding protein
LCVGAALVATGCGGDDRSSGRPVVAAFYPLAYAAEQVGAKDVVSLTPAGAEPHEFELDARDVERVREASLVVYVGRGFQPAVEEAVAGRDGPSLDVLDELSLLSDGNGGVDPHVWLDPTRYASIARAIARARGDLPAADGFAERLRALDEEFRTGLERCRSRRLVTSHAAFAYLADRYGLDQVSLLGPAPDAEPGPQELERLVADVQRSGVTTVFAETLVAPDLAETVAREAGVATAVLDPLEGLPASEIDAGADYFSVMRRNLATLRKALGCR